ncbi:MAG: prephenate dehydrogenase [Chloroflexota bacterium]|nr:prephenate dehydrogenase [Chloroflexota bacterium]
MTSLGNSRIAIVGLGLMGGSLAAALSESKTCSRVVGIARRQWSIDQASQRRWIDHGTLDLRRGVNGADIVVLATPVRTIIQLIGRIGPWLNEECLLMDVGSTKREIISAMEGLPPGVEPVGGHPMCGKEVSGLEAAEPDLYEGAPFILTPLERTSPAALVLAQELVRAVGAHPLILDAELHDRLVGAVSHLPYLVAAALVQTAEGVGDERVWRLAASGFRDTSRLASSDVDMMRDILLTNRGVMVDLLRRYQDQLDRWLIALEMEDEEELERMMRAARRGRALSSARKSEDGGER